MTSWLAAGRFSGVWVRCGVADGEVYVRDTLEGGRGDVIVGNSGEDKKK